MGVCVQRNTWTQVEKWPALTAIAENAVNAVYSGLLLGQAVSVARLGLKRSGLGQGGKFALDCVAFAVIVRVFLFYRGKHYGGLAILAFLGFRSGLKSL